MKFPKLPTHAPLEQTAPSLVFGLKRTVDQRLLFMMDAAAVTGGRGFRPDFGERLLGLSDAPERKKLYSSSLRATRGGQRGKIIAGQARLWRS